MLSIAKANAAAAAPTEQNGWSGITTFLAVSATLLVFLIVVALMYKDIPDKSSTTLTLVIGIIIGKWGSIYDYFFGSSSGSAAKSKSIENLVADNAVSNEKPPEAEGLADRITLAFYSGMKAAVDGKKIEECPYTTKEMREAFEKGFREFESKLVKPTAA